MTTLTASQILSGYAQMGVQDRPRLSGLRALFARMADASRAAEARRAMAGLNQHMLRDLGLTSADLDHL